MTMVPSLLAAISLFISIAGVVFVSTPSELLNVFENPIGGFVIEPITLLADLDFSLITLEHPLGYNTLTQECAVYQGEFDGHEHSIKGLKMGSELSSFSSVGLFCGLDGATIKNLVIDSSSSFDGQDVGALSIKVTGRGATISSVDVKANVKGSRTLGGFIGYVEGDISFQFCHFTGSIESSLGEYADYAGGFIGYVKTEQKVNIEFYHCRSNGHYSSVNKNVGGLIGSVYSCQNVILEITSSYSEGSIHSSDEVGGFIGSVYSCWSVTLKITSSVSMGSIYGSDAVGGFIGSINNNNEVKMTIRSSKNSGNVYVIIGSNVGGFIGSFKRNSGISVDIDDCSNGGEIEGKSYVAGFIGYIDELGLVSSLSIINSVNSETINAKNLVSCGFFCIDESATSKEGVTVKNSVNYGNVTSEKAYGISNHVGTTSNVVNFGSVQGKVQSYSLWDSPSSDQKCFALNSTCQNCGTAVRFVKNEADELYYVLGTRMHIDDMLNHEVSLNQNWLTLKSWTKSLAFFIPESPSYESPSYDSYASRHCLSSLLSLFVFCVLFLTH